MNRVGLLGLAGVALAAGSFAMACERRTSFIDEGTGRFDVDASPAPDTIVCGQQCSIDRRSIVDSCTGEVVKECADNLACGAGTCQEPCAAASADQSSNGCEFYLQPPLYTKGLGQSCYAAFVVNTSNRPVDVTLEENGTALDLSKAMFSTKPGDPTLIPHEGSVAPGESVILFVSDRGPGGPLPTIIGTQNIACPLGVVAASYTPPVPDGTGVGSSIRVKTSLPIGLSSIYPFGGASSYLPSATLHLPVASWAKQNIIINGWEGYYSSTPLFKPWPGAQLVASADTDVTIVPTRDIQDGSGIIGTPAHVPAKYHLRQGQYLQLVQEAELSGSLVYSDAPLGIFGGHTAPSVPTSSCCADILNQQIPAFEQWGNEYVGVGYRPRLGNEHELMPYRIVAARDGTRLDYDPAIPAGAPLTLSAGEVATFVAGTGDAFVVRTQDADHPIFLGAYMSSANGGGLVGSQSFGGRGDPEFVNVIAAGQYLNAYDFFADPTYDETSLVVVRQKNNGKFDDVWLECAGDLTTFQPVGTRGDFEFTRVDLVRSHGPGETFGTSTCKSGLQRMHSKGAFTATIWGWSGYASYAYPGGMAQRKLVPNALPEVH